MPVSLFGRPRSGLTSTFDNAQSNSPHLALTSAFEATRRALLPSLTGLVAWAVLAACSSQDGAGSGTPGNTTVDSNSPGGDTTGLGPQPPVDPSLTDPTMPGNPPLTPGNTPPVTGNTPPATGNTPPATGNTPPADPLVPMDPPVPADVPPAVERTPDVPCADPIPVTAGTPATVTVDLAGAPLATVGADLMGIHLSVYDNSFVLNDTTSGLLQAAGVTSVRFPGGSYADLYHWETHTGTTTPAAGAGSNIINVLEGTGFGAFAQFLDTASANAFITINYGSNTEGDAPATPESAAAWVAYANGAPTNTQVIGVDDQGRDWGTVGEWASLRAASPLAVDDGQNFLRIARPAPVGVRYWEIGNEVYGNGFYHGSGTFAGWEVDFHAPYNGTDGTGRLNNPALGPAVYAAAVAAFSAAMKAVDPSAQIGAVIDWPFTQYSDPNGPLAENWNANVLGQCDAYDFVVQHWYAGGPGDTVSTLLSIAQIDLPPMYADLRAAMMQACGAIKPIGVSEWGPDTLDGRIVISPPAQTQLAGIWAAESYAHFMEQGALAVHFHELHSGGRYLSGTDTPSYGYHGQEIASYLGAPGEVMMPATVSNAGALAGLLYTHASRSPAGSVRVMVTNTSGTSAANVTINLAGGTPLACGGTRYTYAPVNGDEDGQVTSAPIYSDASRTSVAVAVPAYSSVVVAFRSE